MDEARNDPVAVGIALAVGARVVLDLLWWVDAPVPEANLPRVASAVLTGAFALIVWWRRDRIAQDPLRWLVIAFVGLLALGLFRAPDPVDGARAALRYASPLLLALAVKASFQASRDRALLPLVVALAALVPIGWSLSRMAQGGPDLVLHDLPRYVGGYRNLHSHAIAMAFLASFGVLLAIEARREWQRALGVIVALGAGTALVSTWVRTGLVLLAVVVLVLLALRGRWLGLALFAVAAVGAVFASDTLRTRFADVGALLTLTPPEAGWDTLFSGRVAMWRGSFTAFLDLGTPTVLMGTGLGGYLHFWKGKNPHDEFLLLWYQVGVLGPIVFAALLGTAGWQAWQRRNRRGLDGALARFAVALTIGVFAVSLVSNAFLDRLTAAWLYWAIVAAATVPDQGMRASSAGVATPASRSASR